MRRNERHAEADALRGQDLTPILDHLLVGPAHRSDVAIKIVETERIDGAPLLAKADIPIDLIRQGVSREADNRRAEVSDPQDVGPFLSPSLESLPSISATSPLRSAQPPCEFGVSI